jgi:hypothetical protein
VHFALERFEPFLQGRGSAPALVDELQQTLQRLAAKASCSLFRTDFRYTFHGPISGGYL